MIMESPQADERGGELATAQRKAYDDWNAGWNAAIASLQTQSSESAPKWSPTPPTKDGWYWLKEGHEVGMARVDKDCFWQYGKIFAVADVDGGLWCGPLQEPTND